MSRGRFDKQTSILCGTIVSVFLDNDGVSLALERRGDGPRHVVFAHGWISTRRMFYDVAARLDPALFTSHLLDFRGVGHSDRPEGGHDVAGYASDLRVAVEAADAPVTLVAHSMGGKVAQFLALEPPANLERLVLVAPGTSRGLPANERHRARAVEAFGSRRRIERFLRAAMIREPSPEALAWIVDDALGASREAWFGWYDRGRSEDFSARMPELAVPTIVVAGERDPLVPPSRLRRDVVSAIRGASLVTLLGVGHNIPIEAPDDLAQIVARV